tara:strand:+ start:825 stop:983 length:159 start_codon:yes stop_codon:yes gene_type:complete
MVVLVIGDSFNFDTLIDLYNNNKRMKNVRKKKDEKHKRMKNVRKKKDEKYID